MKIIYGCNGEGRGHAARVAALLPELSKTLDITVWCPETVQSFLHDHCNRIKIRTIPGLHFTHKEHKIDYLRTLIKNTPLLRHFDQITSSMAKEMEDGKIEGVISDFEPLTAAASAKAGVPLVNLNHPAVVRRYISFFPDAIAAQMIAALMTPPAQMNLICSFYDGDVGPILRKEIQNATPKNGNHILVYVKRSSVEAIQKVLAHFTDTEFHIFPNSEKDFITSLAECGGVVAPAGHQLLSEALFLKKPVLAIPQQRQFEQRLNAQMLKASGWGRGTEIRSLKRDLSQFLKNLDKYPYKADPFHKFLTGDHTEKTASIIQEFFKREILKGKLSPRISSDYFSYMPERIKHLKGLIA